ncbi:hypothetical protein [Calycomorphotria hydatis]|uniref:hypothetical protein n=1 Tax=Calycomorphotria hydatis TaxID=2528027 RepID=UPI00119E7959|nr:hypothetical protein [Calycomorphotria hydatis]
MFLHLENTCVQVTTAHAVLIDWDTHAKEYEFAQASGMRKRPVTSTTFHLSSPFTQRPADADRSPVGVNLYVYV